MGRLFSVCILGLFGMLCVAENLLGEARVRAQPNPFVETAKNWKQRVYLATYPRSGNHWMRYLIEEATGIATSSTYIDRDPQHLGELFPWGGFCCKGGYEGECRYPGEGEIAVVKTHFPALRATRFDKLPFTRAVRMIRHPIDSFYSYYSYKNSYQNQPVEFMLPREKLNEYILSWRKFQEHWDVEENVLTVRYEDFYRAPVSYLAKILEHMGYQVDPTDVDRAVAKYPPVGGLLKNLSHFTEKDLRLVEAELGGLMQRYGYTLTEIKNIDAL